MITTWDDLLARLASGYGQMWPFYGEGAVSTSQVISQSQSVIVPRFLGFLPPTPALPSGVTGYLPTGAWGAVSTTGYLTALLRLINLGSLDISGASGTFTDGVAFPSVIELGVTRQLSGPVLLEVTTALSASPGSMSMTYVDDAGNTGQVATGSFQPNVVKGSCSFLNLATDDFGVRDVTAASRSAGTTPSGVITFWGVAGVLPLLVNSQYGGLVSYLNGPQFECPKLGAGETWRLMIVTTSSGIGCFGGLFVIGDT